MLNRTLLLLLLLTSCASENQNTFTPIETIRIWGDNTMGFLTNDGDTLIPLGPYKFLNPIDKKGMILAHTESGKSGYINIHRDTIVPFIYEDLGLFVNELAPAKKNGLWGFVDRKGQEVISFGYESESYFRTCDLASVQKKGKFGFINKKGRIVIPIEFEAARDTKVDSVVALKNGGKWAFFNCKGKQLTRFRFERIIGARYNDQSYTFFLNGPCLVEVEDGYGYINDQFNFINPPGTFQQYKAFDPSKTAIVNSGGYSIIDQEGKTVTSMTFDDVEYFPYPHGRYKVEKDRLKGLFDKSGKEILAMDYQEIIPNYIKIDTSTIKILILKNSNNQASVIDQRGNVLVPEEYESISKFMHMDTLSFSIVQKENRYALINSHGEIVLPVDYEEISEYSKWGDYLLARREGKEGLITKSGKTVIPSIYDSLKPCYYDENNSFIVQRDGLFGVIDLDQQIIIPIEFDYISNWVEYGPEAHFVEKDGKRGLIGRDGKMIVPPVYDELEVNNSDIIRVKSDGLYGTVNWNHKIIHQIKYDEIQWEWPHLSGPVDTIYIKERNRYFTTNIKGQFYESSIPESKFLEKFEYLND